LQKRIWQAVIGTLFICGLVIIWRVAPTFSSTAVPRLADRGIGYDPLTENEAARALALALQANESFAQPAVANGSAAPVEVLSVERYDAPKPTSKTNGAKGANAVAASARRGDIYLYDYATDTLIHTIVSLESGTIQREEMQGVQLPLTAREDARALQLVQDDTELWAALSDRYQLITGEQLATTDQMQVKVSLFLGESMPDQVNDDARQCGQHRCAQILLFTVDRTLLEVMPIVDLSQGRVIQRLNDSWRAPQKINALLDPETDPAIDPVEGNGS